MKTNYDSRPSIDKAQLKALHQKNDRSSLIKTCLQLGMFAGMLTLIATADLPWFLLWPCILLLGFLIFALYAPFHETTHETAFRSPRLNLIVSWVTGLIYGYSPGVHRWFHFEHHRHTNKEKDPEKGFSLPDKLPGKIPLQVLLAGVLGMLVPFHSLMLSVVPIQHWDRAEAAWTPISERKKLQWESRAVTVFWIGILTWLAFYPALLGIVLVSIFLGRLIHGFVTVAEHEGMADHGHMYFRTRTVVSNPVFRWFWWNMNFHSEHHAWPSIPWHQLPTVHSLTADQGMAAESGYRKFYTSGRFYDAPEISVSRIPENA